MNRSEAGKLGATKSKETQDRLFKARVVNYNTNPKVCLSCTKPIEYKYRYNTFCNQSCAATYNNKGVSRHGRLAGSCTQCGAPKERSTNKYCSIPCQKEFEYRARVKEWLSGNQPNCTSGTPDFIKKYLIETRGNKCEECSWCRVNPYSKSIPIELEHIDGNSENNTLDNLKLLCPNCHSLTPTYKALNKGNGRHSRMQRYREGKSY